MTQLLSNAATRRAKLIAVVLVAANEVRGVACVVWLVKAGALSGVLGAAWGAIIR